MLRPLVLLGFVVGCATDAREPCDEAAATLASCTGQVPTGFREACASDPEQVASAVLAEADGPNCIADGKADGLAEAAFVDGCAALVNAAYWVVWAKSPTSKPLSTTLKTRLRPWYGELVDTARVSWSSGLLTHWRVFGHEVVLEDDTEAQTFGHEIFVRDAEATDTATVALIGHELDHVRQYRAHGGVAGFARAYCQAFVAAGYSYRRNALEVEAYDLQHRIQACMADGTGCP